MADQDTPPDDIPQPIGKAPAGAPVKKKSETGDTMRFLVKLAIIVWLFRSFLFAPFSIPSESMLPRLLIGDYLFVSKWNYGYSRWSLPFGFPPIPGRVFGNAPARGDTVVFRGPPANDHDVIKRVIGLPGDTVQMRGGVLILNGKPVPKDHLPDFIVPLTPNYGADKCQPQFQDVQNGKQICRYPRFRETLPGGRSYEVLDMGQTIADDTELFTVPAGHVFLMGDNRDNSEDSRFSQASGGFGYVPMENIEGKAVVIFWSTDGSANWFLPWTWITATRWSRIGGGF
ncbi:signal peptidase I [uncultured Sphingomonas sp.]|uniref:signal peptidase I n=1 Tax=uncultured Sphingomonas sp. TaxID=158754 RepID=UPI002615411E|nr:signal peptidase I [uncultured Sphingomonas sp.]